MTARKKQPLPFIAPTVGKVCNSHTRPSRHGDYLHYRDGRITDLQGKCIAQAKHHAASNCTGNQIYSK